MDAIKGVVEYRRVKGSVWLWNREESHETHEVDGGTHRKFKGEQGSEITLEIANL